MTSQDRVERTGRSMFEDPHDDGDRPAPETVSRTGAREGDQVLFAPPALVPRVLRRWRLVAAAGVLAAAVGALAGFVSPTEYRAQALVELGPGASDLVTNTVSAQPDIDRRIATETEIITSDRVRAAAEAAVDRELPAVEVSQESTSSLLAVAVTTGDPDSAAADADAYVDAYLTLTSDRTRAQLEPAIDIAKQRVASIKDTLPGLRGLLEDPTLSRAGQDALQSQYENALQERADATERVDTLEGASSLGSLDVRSFAEAVPPSAPSSTPPLRLALIALLVGLVAGAVVAAAVPVGALRRTRR